MTALPDYSASDFGKLVALDVKTGTLRWYYQQVPHDEWGYDVAAPPFLLDMPGGARAVASASKTGWIYINREQN